MSTTNYGRFGELFRERAQISQALGKARLEGESLTLEHNRLLHEAEQASGGSRQRAQLKADRKGEDAKKARTRADQLSKDLHLKEVEIVDMIAALATAAQPLLSADAIRRHNENLTAIDQRLQHIDRAVTSVVQILGALRTAIQENSSISKAAAAQQGNYFDAATSATDGSATALAKILEELVQQSRSLEEVTSVLGDRINRQSLPSTGDVRQVGWEQLESSVDQPNPSQLLPEDLPSLPEQVTVLLFASEPRDQPRLDLDREIREIHSRINEAEFSDRIKLMPWLAAESLDLIPNVNKHKPHMIQFSGHGTRDGILMMGPPNRSEPLAADRLIQMLKWSGDNLRIVFFNLCDSEEHARAAARIVDAAVGMRGRMHDSPARVFAAYMYSGLAFGRSLEHAFHQACAAIADQPDATIPQLFFRDGIEPRKVVLVRPDNHRRAGSATAH